MMSTAVNNQQADKTGQPSDAEQIPFSALFDATSTMDQSPALCGRVEANKWREMPVNNAQFRGHDAFGLGAFITPQNVDRLLFWLHFQRQSFDLQSRLTNKNTV